MSPRSPAADAHAQPQISLLRIRSRAEEIPTVTGNVEEDRDPAVRLGARLANERHPGFGHRSVRDTEVIDTKEEPDSAGCLVPNGRELAFSVRVSEEETSTRLGTTGPTRVDDRAAGRLIRIDFD